MTIRAAYLASSNFALDAFPRCTVKYQLRDFFLFTLDMIELQNDRVRFAAVNAWVRAQIISNPFSVTFNALDFLLYGFLFVLVEVAFVKRALELALTFFAGRMALAQEPKTKTEFVNRLDRSTDAAALRVHK